MAKHIDIGFLILFVFCSRDAFRSWYNQDSVISCFLFFLAALVAAFLVVLLLFGCYLRCSCCIFIKDLILPFRRTGMTCHSSKRICSAYRSNFGSIKAYDFLSHLLLLHVSRFVRLFVMKETSTWASWPSAQLGLKTWARTTWSLVKVIAAYQSMHFTTLSLWVIS